jgi:two-component system, NarL family, response regulator
VIAEAPPGLTAIRQALSLHPQVVVIHAGLGEREAFEMSRNLISADRRQRVVMVTWHDDVAANTMPPDLLEQVWESGAHQVVSDSATGDQLARAVLDARSGLRHLPARPVPAAPAHEESTPTLTRRECQVLAQLAHGASTSEAAQHLVLSPATVKHHLSAVHRKLGARSRTEAVMMAVTRGLIEVDATEVNGQRPITRRAVPQG